MRKILLVAAVVLTFASLSSAQNRPRKTRPKPAPAKAAPVKAAPVKKPLSSGAVQTVSGLTYLITQNGTGPQAKVGDNVTVHYTGTLTNGVKFDSSRDAGQPISFPLGAGKVIKGWDEGISKLRVGDQAIFVIPPTLGYGARGAGGVIPPNATLIFIVELVSIGDSAERPRN